MPLDITKILRQAVCAGVQETCHASGTKGKYPQRPHRAIREQVPDIFVTLLLLILWSLHGTLLQL